MSDDFEIPTYASFVFLLFDRMQLDSREQRVVVRIQAATSQPDWYSVKQAPMNGHMHHSVEAQNPVNRVTHRASHKGVIPSAVNFTWYCRYLEYQCND